MVCRYSFNFLPGVHLAGCFMCQGKSVAVCTDKMTGDEYWVCEEHSQNKGKCQKRQLHKDFVRTKPLQTKIEPISHIKNLTNGIQETHK